MFRYRRRLPGILPFVLALYLVSALTYAHLMPMWEAPDETAHYLYVLTVAREERLPTDAETYEYVQPPMYYWLTSRIFRLLDRVDPALIDPYRPPLTSLDDSTRYDWTAANYRFLWGAHLLRWSNIALGLVTLLLLYRGAAFFTAEPVVPASVLILSALLPQFLHVSASVSNEPQAYLAGAGLFWCLGRLSRYQTPVLGLAVFTLLALVAPIVVKLTVLPLSLAVLAGVAWRVRERYAGRWPRFRYLLAGACILIALIIVLFNLVSDPANSQWRSFWRRVVFLRPDFFQSPLLWEMLTGFINSFWGRLAWRGVGLPNVLTLLMSLLVITGLLASLRWIIPKRLVGYTGLVYLLLATLPVSFGLLASLSGNWWRVPTLAVVLLSLAALLVWHLGRRSEPRQLLNPAREGYALAWLAVGLAVLMIARNTLSTPQFEGRFIFPTLGPVLLLAATGWVALLPRRAVPYMPLLLLAVMLTLNLYLWFFKITPIYYQPFLD